MGHPASHDLQWVVAGDWNLDPGQVEQQPWVALTGARMMQPGACTCHTAQGHSVRDYAMVSSRLAEAHWGAKVIQDFEMATHDPVGFLCQGQAGVATC